MTDSTQLQTFSRYFIATLLAFAAILALPGCLEGKKVAPVEIHRPDGSDPSKPDGEEEGPGAEESAARETECDEATEECEEAPEAAAAEEVQRTPEVCLFENTIVTGASISAGFDTFGSGVALLGVTDPDQIMNFTPQTSPNLSPGLALAGRHGGVLANFAEATSAPLGSDQVDHLLRSSEFSEASVIVAIDLYYWDSVYANEDEGLCTQAVDSIGALIEGARSNNTAVILGNVPVEQEFNGAPRIAGQGLDQAAMDRAAELFRLLAPDWQPPHRECLEALNAEISEQCTADRDCYVVDFFNVMNEVSRDDFSGEIIVNHPTDGEISYTYDQLRVSGDIHFTQDGSDAIQAIILEKINTAPPSCAGTQ